MYSYVLKTVTEMIMQVKKLIFYVLGFRGLLLKPIVNHHSGSQ